MFLRQNYKKQTNILRIFWRWFGPAISWSNSRAQINTGIFPLLSNTYILDIKTWTAVQIWQFVYILLETRWYKVYMHMWELPRNCDANSFRFFLAKKLRVTNCRPRLGLKYPEGVGTEVTNGQRLWAATILESEFKKNIYTEFKYLGNYIYIIWFSLPIQYAWYSGPLLQAQKVIVEF